MGVIETSQTMNSSKKLEKFKEIFGKEIASFPEVLIWVNEVSMTRTGSENTKKIYLDVLAEFCMWSKKTPTELIQESVAALKPGEKSLGENRAMEYFVHRVSIKKVARTTAKMNYGAVRSFFRANNILFIKRTPQAKAQRKVLPPRDKFVEVYRYASLKVKRMIGIINDTGMRIGDAASLTFKDIRNSYERRDPRIYIEKDSEKEDLPFGVCLSLATTRLIYMDLDERVKGGEKLEDSTPLFPRKGDHGPIGENQFYRYVKDAINVVGIDASPKSFRKRFRTYATPIIGVDATCKMAAWKIPGVGGNYFLPPPEETVKEYQKIESAITLEPLETHDPETQKMMAASILKAAGLDPERLLRTANVGERVEDQADFLTKKLVEVLREKRQ